MDEVCAIIQLSGLPYTIGHEVYYSTEFSNEMKKFKGLTRCFEKNDLTFKDLKEIVEKGKIRTAHTICKVRLK